MIPCVPHSVAPAHLPVLEQKFSAYLPVVATLEGTPSCFEILVDGADYGRRQRVLHVLWTSGAKLEGTDHPQLRIELLGRVGVYRVRAFCFTGVHGNKIGLTAPDDNDLGGGGKGVEGTGSDGCREAAEVFLTVLSR